MPGYERIRSPVERLLRVNDTHARQELSPDPIVALVAPVGSVLPPYGLRAQCFRTIGAVSARIGTVRVFSTGNAGFWLLSFTCITDGTYLALEPVDGGGAIANQVDLAAVFNSFDFGAQTGAASRVSMFGGDAAASAAGSAEPMVFLSTNVEAGVRMAMPLWVPPEKQLRVSGATVNTGFQFAIGIAFGP